MALSCGQTIEARVTLKPIHFPKSNQQDIPGGLRELADAIQP